MSVVFSMEGIDHTLSPSAAERVGVRTPEVPMSTAATILCLATVLGAAPADDWSWRMTSPSTWGTTAWGEFKFGMGPGDVSRIIQYGGAPEWVGPS
jgi:hypothetical protein